MLPRTTKIWLVGSLTLSRLVVALVFALLAFQNVSSVLLACIYAIGITSDQIDGYLARRLEAQTYFGKVIDLVSDKSLTIVSLLYAAACGITIFPLAFIAIREVIMIGARMIVIEGTQLFPTSKMVGGFLQIGVWGTTLFLILTGKNAGSVRAANITYYGCSIFLALNLLFRIYVSRARIKASLICD